MKTMETVKTSLIACMVCLFMSLAGSANADLIAHWSFEDDLNDATGTFDGTATGTPVYAAGAPGAPDGKDQALDLDGLGATAPAGVTAGPDLTVAFWMKADAQKNQRPIGAAQGSGVTTPGWLVMLRTNGHVWFRALGDNGTAWNGGDLQMATDDLYEAGTWVHMAFTFDSVSRELKGYINGNLRGTATIAAGSSIGTPADVLRFGVGDGSLGEAYAGVLDEVAVWDNTLTAQEAMDVYINGVNSEEEPILEAGDPVPEDKDKVIAKKPLTLRWKNMDPIDANSPTTVDVYFGTDPNNFGTPIVDGQAVTSVDVDASVLATYYWRVDSDTGGPNPIVGTIWRFTTTNQPNVVIFFTDDQGTLDANCYGSNDLYTPTMNNLAQTGVRFTQAYAHTVCCPARAMLMTGRYPQRVNVGKWTQSDANAAEGVNMFLEEVTLAEALKGAGYKTALFGKWHLGADFNHGPTKQGFDEFFGHRGGFIHNYNHYFLHNLGFHDLYEGTQEVFSRDDYFPDLMTNRSLAFIDENKDSPFFMYVAFNIPHYPELPDAKFDERYASMAWPRRSYAKMVSTTDDRMGQIIDRLEQQGLRDNTIIVFMSDNGHSSENASIGVDNHTSGLPKGTNYGANGGGGNTGKWIGHKGDLLEGGIRVPAIISYPSILPQNVVRDQAITAMDWMPTVLELCDVPLPEVALDGKSIVSVINSETADSPHEILHWQWYNKWAVRRGDWKLINDNSGTKLYNLSDSQPEQTDYKSAQPAIFAELTALHEQFLIDLEPPVSDVYLDLTPAQLMGHYEVDPAENNWHIVTVTPTAGDGNYQWTNAAGVSWSLTADLVNGLFRTGPDYPYSDNPHYRIILKRDSEGNELPEVEGLENYSGGIWLRTGDLAGSGAFHEAEDHSAQSGCTVQTSHTGYTGTGYVDMGGSGSWFQWDIISGGGDHQLKFRYALGASSAGPCTVHVNGGSAGTASFPDTGGWETWFTDTLNVTLARGANTIRITASNQDSPNIDSMTIPIFPDLTGDRKVDLADFAVISAEWLSSESGLVADIYPPDGGDGIVDIQDLAELSNSWLEDVSE